MNTENPGKDRTPFSPALVAAAIAIVTFLPFIPAINAGFCEFDDPAIFKDVDGYRGLAPKNLAWMFTTTHMGHYQPLTWLSYAINHAIGGMEPRGYHVGNILLHCLNAALVYLLARRLLGTAVGRPQGGAGGGIEAAAAGAALIFAVHPLRVESVAWLTERRDVLSASFLLMAALAYLRAFPPRSIGPASMAWYIASVALLLLSLLSKAWGMTFFVVLLVIDWFPLGRLPGRPVEWLRPPVRRVFVQKLPYAVLGLATAAMATHATASIPYTVLSFSDWGLGARIVQSAYGLMFYVQKLIWPTGLASMYELPRGFNPFEARFLVPWAFVGATGVLIFQLRSRWPALAAAALAYVVILGPVLGFRQSGPQLVADRYTYLSTISWTVLAAGAALWWARRSPGRVPPLIGATLGAAAVLSALTWRQTGLWRDTTTLFKHNIDVGADGPLARIFYARQLAAVDRKEEAVEQFRRATELSPSFGEAWFGYAGLLRDAGRVPEAEAAYLIAQKLMPDSWRASLMLGVMYMTRLDRPAEAEAQFRAAVANVESARIEFFSARPYLMLAAALDIKGDERGARQMLEKASQYAETRAEALEKLREMNGEPQR